MSSHINKLTFAGLLLLLLAGAVYMVYLIERNQRLEKQVERLDDPVGRHVLYLELMTRVLIKQHIHESQIEPLFTFDGQCMVEKADTSDFCWRGLDYNQYDMEYLQDFDQLYYIKGLSCYYLLFRNGYWVDYRFIDADRKLFDYFVQEEGI